MEQEPAGQQEQHGTACGLHDAAPLERQRSEPVAGKQGLRNVIARIGNKTCQNQRADIPPAKQPFTVRSEPDSRQRLDDHCGDHPDWHAG